MNQTPEEPMSDASMATSNKSGGKTRRKLKFLDGLSALAVLLLALEFWLFSGYFFAPVALWLLIIVVLAAQILKLRLSCPNCGGSVYRGWRYSYQSKVPGTCHHCGKDLP